MGRFFFKHRKCTAKRLGSYAIEATSQQAALVIAQHGACPHCGMRARVPYHYTDSPTFCPKFMGQVRGSRLIATELRTPCDGRCTGATGPNCDCQCNGENHGIRMLIEISRDAGAAPKQ